MHDPNATSKAAKKRSDPALLAVGTAVVAAYVSALLARRIGMLFSGLDTAIALVASAVVSLIVAAITEMIVRRKGKDADWRVLVIEVLLVGSVVVLLLGWAQTRDHMRIFMNPLPIPNEVRVHHGQSVLFNSFVHFTAPPTVVAALLKSKEFVEVPDEVSDQRDISGYGVRQRTKVSWDWWQPATMSGPRFYYRHHKSDAVQGWMEGWWVNGATNEVYAHTGG